MLTGLLFRRGGVTTVTLVSKKGQEGGEPDACEPCTKAGIREVVDREAEHDGGRSTKKRGWKIEIGEHEPSFFKAYRAMRKCQTK